MDIIDIREILMDKRFFLTTRTTISSLPGGKSDRKKHAPLYFNVPLTIDYLVEPFVGLANFFIVISPRVNQAWLNDKDPETYALLRCIREKQLLQQLIEVVKSLEPIERDDYYYWKKKQPKNVLEQAIRRLIILNCSVNGAGGGYSHEKAHRKWYFNKPKKWFEINAIMEKKKVIITNKDYLEVIDEIIFLETHNDKKFFIYLDPPYYSVAKKGSLYGKDYNIIDWKLLKNKLSQLKSTWILSNRDDPKMKELFSEYYVATYNTYNDMNNTRNKNPELIISNKPLKTS